MRICFRYEDENDRTLVFAAGEAAGYLGRMLPEAQVTVGAACCEECGDLCITLGVVPDENEADHFDIRIPGSGETGRITGNHSRSVLIGVYHYLYLLGCRFLGPGKDMELVPVLTDTAELFRQFSHTAGYYHRGVCIEGSESLENTLDFIDWLPKLGYNTFFIQFQIPYTFLARWYHHEGNALAEPEAFTAEDAAEYAKVMVQEMRKRDLLLQQVGHGWTGESIGIPSMDWKESSYVLSDEQRSMLAQVDGKRDFFQGIPMNTNLCYTNPEVIEAFSESVVRYAAEHPEVDYLHVWLADVFNNICECEECQKSMPTDQYVHILNEIDRKLTRKGLDTRIIFLLYQELLWPPRKSRLENPERFVLMFAPISRSFNSSYQISEKLPDIQPYVKNRITLPVDLDQNLAYLRAWQEHFSGDGFVYDYHLGRAHFGDFGYVHISRIISEDISRLHDLCLNGLVSCQELRAGMPNFLPNYVMGRMLMDESCSFDRLAEEYYQAAYGERWKEVYAYLSALSGLCDCDYFNRKGPRENPEVAEKMRKAHQLTDSFAASGYFNDVPEDPVHARFQDVLRYHCRYIVHFEDAIGALAAGRTEEAKGHWDRFLHMISEHETQFQPYLDVYRIREVSLNYTGFRKYCGCGEQR